MFLRSQYTPSLVSFTLRQSPAIARRVSQTPLDPVEEAAQIETELQLIAKQLRRIQRRKKLLKKLGIIGDPQAAPAATPHPQLYVISLCSAIPNPLCLPNPTF